MLNFELHQLGWFSFEELCRTICREVWDAPVEAYSHGSDGGRDGSFTFRPTPGSPRAKAIIQCKHRSDPSARLRLDDIRGELPKVKAHVEAGRCERYVLMTNAKVSGGVASAIDDAFRSVGVRGTTVFGYEGICELLTTHKSLRALVPRLYGLGDLTEILDERRYAQAEAILASMHDQIACLVPVEAHRRAHHALVDERFALLIGQPGSGKSSIAASLAVGAIDEFDARPVKLDHVRDLENAWNPREPNQLFWLDDAFGATQLDQVATDDWNRNSPRIRAALRGGARFIVTSRDYIWNAARATLKAGELPALDSSKIVIEVERFSRTEREQILYNHLRLGRQPKVRLKQLKVEDLERIAADERFLPEIARRIAQPEFTRDIDFTSQYQLLRFVREPVRYLHELLCNFDPASRAALGLVHMHGNHLAIPPSVTDDDDQFLTRAGVPPHEAFAALQLHSGSMLRESTAGNERWWQFAHPSLIDAYEVMLGENPVMLHEYLVSARFNELTRTVTCGDMGIEGAVIVPSSEFDTMIERLVATGIPRRRPHDLPQSLTLVSFLATRCNDDFLRRIVSSVPMIIDEAFGIGMHLTVDNARATLIERLLGLELATESNRKALIRKLIEDASESFDGTFLADERWMAFFTDDELAELDQEVETNLDGLEEYIDVWLQNDREATQSADATVSAYEARYPDNPNVGAARERLTSFESYEPDLDDDAWREHGSDPHETEPLGDAPVNSERSVFDDLADIVRDHDRF